MSRAAHVTLEDFTDATPMVRAGVYALTWRNKVVYVGKTTNLFRRLYEHKCNSARNRKLFPWEPKSNKMIFDGMRYITLAPDHLDQVEREMINRYRPKYNVLLKPPSEVPLTAPLELDFGNSTFTLNPARRAQGIPRRV